MTSCSLVEIYECFEVNLLPLTSTCSCMEEGNSRLLRNLRKFIQNYTASYPRRQYSSPTQSWELRIAQRCVWSRSETRTPVGKWSPHLTSSTKWLYWAMEPYFWWQHYFKLLRTMTILQEVVISANKFHILNVNVYQHLMLTGKFNFSANWSNLMQAKHKAPVELKTCTKIVRYNTRRLGNLRPA